MQHGQIFELNGGVRLDPLTELDAREIAAWRMILPSGHRFEATASIHAMSSSKNTCCGSVSSSSVL